MIAILLNGPPRAGKDTVAELLVQQFSSDIHLEKFANPIKRAIPIAYSIPQDVWKAEVDTTENKDLRNDWLFGKTPREVQINFSESFLKPMHDKNIFGQLLLRRIHHLKKEAIVISDSGFREEAEQVVHRMGARNVFLWRIYRQGCDFKKDSRSYIDLSDLGVMTLPVYNDAGINELRRNVAELYEACTLPRESHKDEHGISGTEPDELYYPRRNEAILNLMRKRTIG